MELPPTSTFILSVPPASHGCTDPYVKVSLMCDGRRLKKRKTSTKRNTLNPVYNEAIVFDVPPENIDQIHLSIAVMDYDRWDTWSFFSGRKMSLVPRTGREEGECSHTFLAGVPGCRKWVKWTPRESWLTRSRHFPNHALELYYPSASLLSTFLFLSPSPSSPSPHLIPFPFLHTPQNLSLEKPGSAGLNLLLRNPAWPSWEDSTQNSRVITLATPSTFLNT